MNASSACAGLLCFMLFASAVQAACKHGAYASDHGDFVVVAPLPNSQSPGQRYMFRDGRRGSTADDNAPVTCMDGAVTIKRSNGASERWAQIPLTATDTRFSNLETQLVGD